MTVLFACGVVFATARTEAQVVQFADPNLDTAVKETLGIADTQTIRQAHMLRLTSLDASRKQITDLTGLEYARNLTRLSASANQIRSIAPLANLTQLTDLSLYNNQIFDVNALAGLARLTGLYLDNNQIADISPLCSLMNLISLNLPVQPAELGIS